MKKAEIDLKEQIQLWADAQLSIQREGIMNAMRKYTITRTKVCDYSGCMIKEDGSCDCEKPR